VSDEIRKRERLNEALIKMIRTQLDHAAQENAEFRNEIADIRRRLDKIEKQTPSAPDDPIKKGADEGWPRRADPSDITRRFMHDAPRMLQ
jgi:hypothetical protein